MGFSKKTAKGRLDKYYHLAKEQGYRARSAFKLIQLNKKYGFLAQSRCVVDLCAAPGGWLQVAAKYMPVSHVLVGVDLVPIKPIAGVVTLVDDITTEKCRVDLKRELKGWKADVVLHDGAPNVGRAWLQDAYSQAELVLASLKLATELLAPEGTFVTKIFRSKEYNALLWVFGQLFGRVDATKPASSRSVSAEIFVVCREYKAPGHIDPRFLDPRSVFEELSLPTKAITNILHPEKRTSNREGYEEGVTILHKTTTASEFIASSDPAGLLATINRLTFEDEASAALSRLPFTNAEISNSCGDLKVIGRKEFKALLKWRLAIRKARQMDEEETKEVAEVEDAAEENSLDELEALEKRQGRVGKKEKRKALERKAKQRMRMQLHMQHGSDIAIDTAATDGLFSLKVIKNASMIDVAPEDVAMVEDEEEKDQQESIRQQNVEFASGSEDAELERALDDNYEDYKQERLRRNHKDRARKKLGFESKDVDNASVEEREADESEAESDSEFIVDLQRPAERKDAAAAKVALWYSNPLFSQPAATSASAEKDDSGRVKRRRREHQDIEQELDGTSKRSTKKTTTKGTKSARQSEDRCDIEFVQAVDSVDQDEELKAHLLTPTGMTLATKLVDRKSKKQIIDDSFNRFAFNDEDGVPAWFHDDEQRHNRPQLPITKEAMAVLREKLKSIDARPIKKVMEAKGRNKLRAMRRFEELKKKAAVVADSEDMNEKSKMTQMEKILRRPGNVTRKKRAIVVAKGGRAGLKGRPSGVKGRYKMVDRRLLKDQRGLKKAGKFGGAKKKGSKGPNKFGKKTDTKGKSSSRKG